MGSRSSEAVSETRIGLAAGGSEPSRGPFPWHALRTLLCELVGFALIAFVLWLVWPPLPLALLGALMVYFPNRS